MAIKPSECFSQDKLKNIQIESAEKLIDSRLQMGYRRFAIPECIEPSNWGALMELYVSAGWNVKTDFKDLIFSEEPHERGI